ncbi:ABC transporter ATP-binding protein [Vallitalea pronyensis]|uniref:ABC transporter ATP-binding protein n=1 Tax=Vallitalea pronyensis TaxID=1348613 RepID=A0A8J8SF43_9FIRM|nr:ABC transporter ATP-binding protein [Vallitalea pronyensis]QUI20878.1 ABC transporter ATP-binding protein [Vallitalea pronyensis]
MIKKLRIDQFIRVMRLIEDKFFIYVLSLFISTFSLAMYEIINSLINKELLNAAVTQHYDLVYKIIIFAVITFIILNVVFDPVARYINRKIIRKTIFHIRVNVFRHLMDYPMTYFKANHSGDLLSKVNNDLNQLEGAYGDNIHRVISTLIQGIGATITMFLLDWRLACMTIGLGIISMVVNMAYAKPLGRISDKIQKYTGTSTQYFTDILSGISIIKICNIQKILTNKYYEVNKDITDEEMKKTALNAQNNSLNFLISFLNIIGILCIGVIMFNYGLTDIGTIMAIITLQNSSNNLFLRLGGFFSSLQSSLSGAVRILELLDNKKEPQMKSGIGEPSIYRNDIVAFKNVSFRYGGKNDTIKNINIHARKNETVALVGPSGGGKSTILELMLGFYTVEYGDIIINEKSIKSKSMTELRNEIAYVPQNVHLFGTTVEENIRYGNLAAHDQEVIRAAKAANAHDFIMALPKGYQTIIEQGGEGLSGGQKQRIAIARAFLKDAPILLLDEPTSSLDTMSEGLIQQALERLATERTIIMNTHRLSTIQKVDRIYVINQGEVVEAGHYNELINQSGLFNKLIYTML